MNYRAPISTIPVSLPDRTYNVAIAPGGLERMGTYLAENSRLGKKILLVSNPTVFELYGERAIASLAQAGFDVAYCIVPDGEQYKTLQSIQTVYDAALGHRLERSSTLVSLGGGVIGDMTGFAAATWLRGIHFVQVPTSLLAMVDASIGGKTGVNHPQGKNLIGAFYQPQFVLLDPDVLSTLPDREFRAGMAEVIKYGVIWDAALFDQLDAAPRLDSQAAMPTDLLQTILLRSCRAKADVVGQDEKEAGLRAILNYGHTLGHAIESLTGYTQINHGEAVAIGMVAAGAIATELGMWSTACQQRQVGLIQKAGLPTQIPSNLSPDAIIDTLQTDKKVKGGKVRFILPVAIGSVEMVDQVSADTLRAIIPTLQS